YALPLAKKCVMTAWAEACPFSVRVWIASKTENPEYVAYAPRTVVSIPSACGSVPSEHHGSDWMAMLELPVGGPKDNSEGGLILTLQPSGATTVNRSAASSTIALAVRS